MQNLLKNNCEEFIKDLQGHSGCRVSLYRDDLDDFFIRKTAPYNYSARLVEQFIKQNKFFSVDISTPYCIGQPKQGEDLGSWYFDMEYVPGISLVEFINRNSIDRIRPIFQTILRWIKSNNTLQTNEIENISNKSKDLGIDIHANFNTSYCHGDLTLENIIIKDYEIYFIDFLDSPINCQEMDIAKLLQDVYLGWSWGDERFPVAKCKMLFDMLCSEFGYKKIKHIIDTLLLLNLHRIKPYANEERNKWVEEKICKIES